jgi:cellulose synthase/poly-beta-1,6-N-acetylglucosamine synthase-like glycosyltransferase
MNSGPPELSVVIPAYNEERRLGRALEHIRDYFSAQPAGMAAIES